MIDFKLENGFRVIGEETSVGHSVSIGVWIKQGSAHEEPRRMGISHLLEHLVFKGTDKRNGREIALSLEALGGTLDAYTTREHTCYYANVLDDDIDVALDVLADLVLSPQLRATDFELERKVVLEEARGINDTPDDFIFDEHAKGFWGDHSYGYPIVGSPDTISAMSIEDVRSLHRERYGGTNLLLACSGNFDQDRLIDRVTELFVAAPKGKANSEIAYPTEMITGQKHLQRDISQTHFVLGSRIPDQADPDRNALILACEFFGVGMSSRLFQNIREELGLAYTVFAFNSFYSRGGMLGVYAATEPGSADSTLEVIIDEYYRIVSKGLTKQEFERTKNQIKGKTILSSQSTDDRLMRIGSFALRQEEYESLEETLKAIDNIQLDEVQRVCQQFFNPEDLYVVKLGP